MNCVDCHTQKELDDALKRGDCPHLRGSGYFTVWGSASVRASDSASVEAWGSASVRASGSASVRASGSASVEAWGSASVRASGSASVRAWDSASVEAWGSASVEAWGSASVRASDSASVEASGSASVRAWGSVQARVSGSAKVTGSKYVVITKHGKRAQAIGGTVVVIPDIETVSDFFDWYGLEPKGKKDPTVTLFKAVDANYLSGYRFSYKPGKTPEAPDWDGGKNCCGGGLHLGPTPIHARRYHGSAVRFIACTVKVADIALIYSPGEVPDKCKVRAISKCVECDIDGEPLKEAATP